MADEENKVAVNVDRDKYTQTRSASGKKSLHNGDPIAEALEGLPLESIHKIGTKLLKEDTEEKYGHLNQGMQRMNVGNRLRKFANESEENLGKLQDTAAPEHSKAEKAREKAEKEKAAAEKQKAAAKPKAESRR